MNHVISALDDKDLPMDLSKSFDTLNHTTLLHKLKYYGINGITLKWFNSYLSNRSQYVEIDNVLSTKMVINTGVPQCSIYTLPIDSSDVNYSLNHELSLVYEWLFFNKVSLNIKKTKFMLFLPYQKDVSNLVPVLKINQNKIERVDKFADNRIGLFLPPLVTSTLLDLLHKITTNSIQGFSSHTKRCLINR